MTKSQQNSNRLSNFRWTGTSRRRAKGKAGNYGILPRNGQIQNVALDTLFSVPNWTKYQK